MGSHSHGEAGGKSLPAANRLPPSAVTRPLVQVVCAAALVSALHTARLFADTPLWQILAAQLGGALLYQLTLAATSRAATSVQRHARLAVRMGAIALFLYLTGWGAALSVTFIVVGAEHLEEFGPRSWRAAAGWAALAVAVNQTLTTVGLLPSIIPARQAVGLACAGGLSVVFVLRHLAQITSARIAETEQRLHAERQAAAARERFSALVTESSDAILVVDADAVVSYATPSVATLAGQALPDIMDAPLTAIVGSDNETGWHDLLDQARREGHAAPCDLLVRSSDGEDRVWRTTCRNLLHEPAVAGLVINARDVTDERRWQRELHHAAYHDALTGIPNRRAFMDRIDALGSAAYAEDSITALLFVDIDEFKAVNDSYGHEVGDALLIEVANRLRRVVPEPELVARIAGDEFAVVFSGPSADSDAQEARATLQASMNAPVQAFGRAIKVSISVGMASGRPQSEARLLARADSDMYRIKANNKGPQAGHPAARARRAHRV